MKKHVVPVITVVAAGIILALTTCKKDKAAPLPPSKIQLLTGKNWIVQAFTIDPAYDMFSTGTPVSDVYSQLPPCEKDDMTLFNDNATVIFDEGATKCNSSDPQTNSGTWSFNTDLMVLTMDGKDYTVMNLTSSELKVKSTFTENSITYTTTITFKH